MEIEFFHYNGFAENGESFSLFPQKFQFPFANFFSLFRKLFRKFPFNLHADDDDDNRSKKKYVLYEWKLKIIVGKFMTFPFDNFATN